MKKINFIKMMALMVALSATSSYAAFTIVQIPATSRTQKFTAVNATGMAPTAMLTKKVGATISGTNQTDGRTSILVDAISFQPGSQIALNTGGSVSGGTLGTGNNQVQGNTVQLQGLTGANMKNALNALQTKKAEITTTTGSQADGDLVLARPAATYGIQKSAALGAQNFANASTNGTVMLAVNDAVNTVDSTLNQGTGNLGNILVNNNKLVTGTQVQAGSNLVNGTSVLLVGSGSLNS